MRRSPMFNMFWRCQCWYSNSPRSIYSFMGFLITWISYSAPGWSQFPGNQESLVLCIELQNMVTFVLLHKDLCFKKFILKLFILFSSFKLSGINVCCLIDSTESWEVSPLKGSTIENYSKLVLHLNTSSLCLALLSPPRHLLRWPLTSINNCDCHECVFSFNVIGNDAPGNQSYSIYSNFNFIT